MPSIIANGKQQYFDNSGNLLVGGKLYTYAAGTLTPKATYADSGGVAANTNPVILDARGEALIYWSGSYKVILKDSLDNVIWTVDNIVETNLDYRTSLHGSVVVPEGTTAQRDVPAFPGYFRFNDDLTCFEGYYGAAWISLVKTVNGVAIPDGGDISAQPVLISGVNIKTLGGTSLLGAGDIGLRTVNGNNIQGAGNIAVQPTLVSGTNIKTVNGISVLGAGDIVITSTVPDFLLFAQGII